MAEIKQTMGVTEWVLLIILSILWGGSFFFVGVAVRGLPPFTIVAMRVTIAAVVLWLIAPLMGHRMPFSAKAWLAFLGMGFLNNAIPFSLIVWGQTHIASGLASILNATTPFFTVLVAHFFLSDERLSGRRLIGVIIGIAGVAIMIGLQALEGLGGGNVALLAQLAIVAATLSYAFSGVYGRRFSGMGIAPVVVATGQLTAAAVMLIPIALLVDQPWNLPSPSLNVWWSIIGLAVFSTSLAYIIYFRILAVAGATNLLLVTLLIPVSAVLLGFTVLGERLEPRHFVGMALLAIGLIIIDGRLLNLIGVNSAAAVDS
ncbi:MAG: DMT family transporter [Chloroflexota bacterium]